MLLYCFGNGSGTVQSPDSRNGVAGEPDDDHSVDVHQNATTEQKRGVCLAIPHDNEKAGKDDPEQDLCELSPKERTQGNKRHEIKGTGLY